MKKRVYLAGAMQAYAGTNNAKAWREDVKDCFEQLSDNFEIISPPDYYEYGKNLHKTEREVFNFDLRKVRECDVVLVNLDKIRESLGTSDEILYAYTLGKPIIGFLESDRELSEEELVNIIHPWKYLEIDRIETDSDAMFKAICYIVGYYEK